MSIIRVVASKIRLSLRNGSPIRRRSNSSIATKLIARPVTRITPNPMMFVPGSIPMMILSLACPISFLRLLACDENKITYFLLTFEAPIAAQRRAMGRTKPTP